MNFWKSIEFWKTYTKDFTHFFRYSQSACKHFGRNSKSGIEFPALGHLVAEEINLRWQHLLFFLFHYIHFQPYS